MIDSTVIWQFLAWYIAAWVVAALVAVGIWNACRRHNR